jgi:hypothetical protein
MGMVSYAMIQMRMQEEIDDLRAAVFDPDWDRVKALEESLREHMAEIQRLKALAQPEQLVVGGDDLPTLTKWAPKRKPLTDDRIDMLLNNERLRWATSPPTYEFAAAFARVIERAHGIGGEHEA